MLGTTNIKIKLFYDLEKVNDFLEEYNGNIIDIQWNNCTVMVVYRYKED